MLARSEPSLMHFRRIAEAERWTSSSRLKSNVRWHFCGTLCLCRARIKCPILLHAAWLKLGKMWIGAGAVDDRHSDGWKNNSVDVCKCGTCVNIAGLDPAELYASLSAHGGRQGHFTCEREEKKLYASHEFYINMDAHCRWSERALWFLIGRSFFESLAQNRRMREIS